MERLVNAKSSTRFKLTEPRRLSRPPGNWVAPDNLFAACESGCINWYLRMNDRRSLFGSVSGCRRLTGVNVSSRSVSFVVDNYSTFHNDSGARSIPEYANVFHGIGGERDEVGRSVDPEVSA